eukprot:6210818-Pleurochrysis_carterae.AAC.1
MICTVSLKGTLNHFNDIESSLLSDLSFPIATRKHPHHRDRATSAHSPHRAARTPTPPLAFASLYYRLASIGSMSVPP